MITLHNLQGSAIAINGALVERVDGGPETHVMLVNGTSYIVKESIDEVVQLHREDRAIVQAMAVHVPVAEHRIVSPETTSKDTGLRLIVRDEHEHEEPAP
ncbi:MAG TPA: flagellar FlbD family protein [Acidimicrobiales bacterium]|nr:flagellar FlbD family protein [Acidimicrobiales bacterium]